MLSVKEDLVMLTWVLLLQNLSLALLSDPKLFRELLTKTCQNSKKRSLNQSKKVQLRLKLPLLPQRQLKAKKSLKRLRLKKLLRKLPNLLLMTFLKSNHK